MTLRWHRGEFRYVVAPGQNALWGPLGCSPLGPPLNPALRWYINTGVLHTIF